MEFVVIRIMEFVVSGVQFLENKMDWWHITKIALGILAVLMSLFVMEFRPTGWTTQLIWGDREGARIPRWLAALFYFIIGVVLLYRGIYK